jgi:hypothetical protein
MAKYYALFKGSNGQYERYAALSCEGDDEANQSAISAWPDCEFDVWLQGRLVATFPNRAAEQAESE